MTKYNSKFQDKAYGLFVQGMPLTQIAKELGVNRKTIKHSRGIESSTKKHGEGAIDYLEKIFKN